MIAFADDSKLYGVVTQELNHSSDLILVQKWWKENSPELNVSKSAVIHFGFCNPIHTCYLNGVEIPLVPQYKDLGIFLDNRLPFSADLSFLAKNRLI